MATRQYQAGPGRYVNEVTAASARQFMLGPGLYINVPATAGGGTPVEAESICVAGSAALLAALGGAQAGATLAGDGACEGLAICGVRAEALSLGSSHCEVLAAAGVLGDLIQTADGAAGVFPLVGAEAAALFVARSYLWIMLSGSRRRLLKFPTFSGRFARKYQAIL